jgi:glutaredoxin-like protein NrdH
VITVYSKPACPQCDATKRHLTTKGIPHQVIDVSIDPAALATASAAGTVPVDRIVMHALREVTP